MGPDPSLVFIGCSLSQDRTLRVFAEVMEERGASDVPEHFAVTEAPADEAGLIERNKFLASLGITPIWYPPGEHNRVREILDALEFEVVQ